MKVAFLTSGGIAPCLTSSISRLIKQYSLLDIKIELIGYLHGYKGLLRGEFINIPLSIADKEEILYED